MAQTKKHAPQKYPFFTRLKKAWAAYNEYMADTPFEYPTTDRDISWYKKAQEKTAERVGVFKSVPSNIKPKHTLVKRKDL